MYDMYHVLRTYRKYTPYGVPSNTYSTDTSYEHDYVCSLNYAEVYATPCRRMGLHIGVDSSNIELAMPTTRIALSLASKQTPHMVAIAQQCFRHATFLKRDIHLSKCYAKEERETFTGQLYASTAQRLERERAEQRRFASARAPRGGRSIGLSFGLPPLRPNPSNGLILNSNFRHLSRFLLHRNFGFQTSTSCIYRTPGISNSPRS